MTARFVLIQHITPPNCLIACRSDAFGLDFSKRRDEHTVMTFIVLLGLVKTIVSSSKERRITGI
jgi:hypothetical protein